MGEGAAVCCVQHGAPRGAGGAGLRGVGHRGRGVLGRSRRRHRLSGVDGGRPVVHPAGRVVPQVHRVDGRHLLRVQGAGRSGGRGAHRVGRAGRRLVQHASRSAGGAGGPCVRDVAGGGVVVVDGGGRRREVPGVARRRGHLGGVRRAVVARGRGPGPGGRAHRAGAGRQRGGLGRRRVGGVPGGGGSRPGRAGVRHHAVVDHADVGAGRRREELHRRLAAVSGAVCGGLADKGGRHRVGHLHRAGGGPAVLRVGAGQPPRPVRRRCGDLVRREHRAPGVRRGGPPLRGGVVEGRPRRAPVAGGHGRPAPAPSPSWRCWPPTSCPPRSTG